MVDGAALLAGMIHGLRASGEWGERGTNLLDTGAWFYEVYETADGGYVSLGADRRAVVSRLSSSAGWTLTADVPDQMDRSTWPAMKERVAA